MSGLDNVRDLNGEMQLMSRSQTGWEALWNTNRLGGSTDDRSPQYGVLAQLRISMGEYNANTVDWTDYGLQPSGRQALALMTPLVRVWQVAAQAALLTGYREGIGDCPTWPSGPGESERLIALFRLKARCSRLRATWKAKTDRTPRPSRDWLRPISTRSYGGRWVMIAFEGIRLLTPIVTLRRGREFLEKEINRVFKPFGIRPKDLTRTLKISDRIQEEFFNVIKSKGEEALSSIKEKTIVIVGRPYNAFDSGVNLEIPKKLADLGVPSIPMDLLPIEEIDIHEDWPNMYWRSGQRILQAVQSLYEVILISMQSISVISHVDRILLSSNFLKKKCKGNPIFILK